MNTNTVQSSSPPPPPLPFSSCCSHLHGISFPSPSLSVRKYRGSFSTEHVVNNGFHCRIKDFSLSRKRTKYMIEIKYVTRGVTSCPSHQHYFFSCRTGSYDGSGCLGSFLVVQGTKTDYHLHLRPSFTTFTWRWSHDYYRHANNIWATEKSESDR